MDKVCIVVPNWNGEDFIAKCLSSLVQQTQKCQIIVVDNGSTDNSVEIINKKFPKVDLIELDENRGFSGGVNKGIQKAIKENFEYIALFNNDAIASKDWLKNLVNDAKKHKNVGIITGKLLHIDKKHIDSTGDMYSVYGMPFPRGRNELDKGQYDKAEEVFGATGGASLYKTKMLKQIGLFDEDFFAYFEDVDISFRAQLAGWNVWYEPKAIAYHHIGGTSAKMGSFARYHSIKNFVLLYNKNMPGWLYWKYKPLFLWQLARIKLGCVRDKQFRVFLRAFGKSVTLMPSTLAKRSKIQQERTVSSAYIQKLLYRGRPPKIPKLQGGL